MHLHGNHWLLCANTLSSHAQRPSKMLEREGRERTSREGGRRKTRKGEREVKGENMLREGEGGRNQGEQERAMRGTG